MNPNNHAIFIPDAVKVAKEAMDALGHTDLTGKFVTVVKFLESNPLSAPTLRGRNKPIVGTSQYIVAIAQQFANARATKKPTPPATIPDEMVSFILHHYFGIEKTELERIKNEHLLSMGAENFVGELLERYIAMGLEPHGWIWVSGSVVKAADFLRPPTKENPQWYILQVKNRDNSENSSSSAIRVGTEIKKWFRTFSRKPGSNWSRFPDTICRVNFSESGFRKFVCTYLRDFKTN